ncbi:hypothetical protein [Anaeromyxobacter sp. Fw109-5]|uniref:hypothetical protein n=1 Tax=Anaeromyxobacter sp. (strain Fw109-5) TaxID=404589 RepID=UPI00031D96AA|nr:hypothetical protein [Anaeromyxobacter sp. Fw109-5]
MALYRFLFAPALLAVAVLAGPVHERAQPVQAEAPRVIATEAAAPAARPPAALERAVAAKHAPRRAPNAKPAR